jgi:hypothetical protein
MSEKLAQRPSWARFALAAAGGLVLALAIYMGMALSECLPRDDSAAMRACDIAKAREFWLYPLLVLVSLTLSIWLHARGSRWGIALALGGAMIVAIALTRIEWLIA